MHIVLYQPEIPGNTGAVSRLCAGTDSPLHLVRPLGFSLSDRYLKRAGLDYWPSVKLALHDDLGKLEVTVAPERLHYFTAREGALYSDVHYGPDDYLVFGPETAGFTEEFRRERQERLRRIPVSGNIRSLNLACAVSVALFEALRQNGFPGCSRGFAAPATCP